MYAIYKQTRKLCVLQYPMNTNIAFEIFSINHDDDKQATQSVHGNISYLLYISIAYWIHSL